MVIPTPNYAIPPASKAELAAQAAYWERQHEKTPRPAKRILIKSILMQFRARFARN